MTTLDQDTRTERQQAVNALRALADLIANNPAVPVPQMARCQWSTDRAGVERFAADLGLTVEVYMHEDASVSYSARFVAGHIGYHPVTYTAYAQEAAVIA